MDSELTKKTFKDDLENKVSREEAEKAVETLIMWAGDNPNREGLKETPKRVSKPMKNFFLATKNHQKIIFLKHSKMSKVMKTL